MINGYILIPMSIRINGVYFSNNDQWLYVNTNETGSMEYMEVQYGLGFVGFVGLKTLIISL